MILLDTHVVIWVALEEKRLSPRARVAIQQALRSADGLAVSSMALFEIAVLVSKGRIRLSTDLETFLQEIETRFVVLPISAGICARAVTFPRRYPKDPVDRIIGATALTEGLSLVTADVEIRRTKMIETIW